MHWLKRTAACLLLATTTGPAAWAGWTLRDSIETPYVTSAASANWDTGSPGLVHRSLDGQSWFLVIRRGELDCDCNRYRLLVFGRQQVEAALSSPTAGVSPQPRTVVERRSFGNRAAIALPRWADDGRAIVFLGLDADDRQQVFRAALDGGDLQQLTFADEGVHAFDYRAGSTIYLTRLDRDAKNALREYPARFVAGYDLSVLSGYADDPSWAVFASFHGRPAMQIGQARRGINPFVERFWLSPDGARAIAFLTVPQDEAPAAWTAYRARHGVDPAEDSARRNRPRVYYRFAAFDLRAGTVRPAVNAPSGSTVEQWAPGAEATWSRDGDRVLLVNTTLPLRYDDTDRRSTAFIVEYQATTGDWWPVTPLPVLDGQLEGREQTPDRVEWGEDGRSVLVHHRRRDRSRAPTHRHVRTASGWSMASTLPPETEGIAEGLSVDIDQGMNRPPRLRASRDGVVRVFDLHPAAAALADLAPTEEYRWTDAGGHRWIGGLTRPHAASDRPLPLVIQIYDFDPGRFMPDGWFPTAFAAQPLAAHGFAVLQMRIRDVEGLGSDREGPSFVRGIDAAVDALSRSGLVDRNRVGLVGFSRGGYLTYYAVTHPGQVPLRAAVAADGWTAGYVEYLLNAVISADTAATLRDFDRQNGGADFWSGKAAWQVRAPGFNLDKVEAPLLISVGASGEGPNHILWTLEPYAGLRILGKPVELLFLPQGEHQLKRPRERLASLSATVDWMRFWLKGEEDASPEKASQYQRWRAMRDRQGR